MTLRITMLDVEQSRYKWLLLSLMLMYCIINILGPLDEPQLFTAISRTYASIHLRWKTCEHWRGPKLGYTVKVFDDSTDGMVGTYQTE